MKKMDETGLKLCKIQAEVFAASLKETDCSSPIFIRRFMNSHIAHRMDLSGFLFEACDISQIFEEINVQFGETSYGQEKYTENELYWIGYIYRYWAYTHEKTSKQIYKIIKPKELRDLYYPYHSLDPAQAIERIMEAKGLCEGDFTSRGVKIMRSIMHDARMQE